MMAGLIMNNLEVVRLKNAVNERDHVSGSQKAPVTLLDRSH